ncbi:unnamed protein product [Adineta steineri]|uniref:Transmembrane protein n=1 Tax=Adineta steineri TaxID=433720 RepID=A0A814QAZ6_9BILA|nr:unnamed protein product [Adineta steineri]CAF1419113.1 unnamed protein product [Adineta steineri]
MLFNLFLLLCIFTRIHSKLLTYTLYQTDDICQYNWKGSICLPIFSLNETDEPLLFKLDINNHNQCPTQTLVYIRTQQCIYCSKNLHDIHCNHIRLRRMIPVNKEHTYRNHIAVISISLAGMLIIGSLFSLFFIKRSNAHTNLLELFNSQQTSNSNIKSLNHIKVPKTIKTTPRNQLQLTIPKTMK